MRVLYFHQHFSTRSGATGTRSYEVARRLVARGHEVVMVCGALSNGSSGLSGPFRRGRREGLVDGIRVIEFAVPYSNSQGFLKRVQVFLSFIVSASGVAMREKYDLAFATSTPLTVGIPGVLARWLRRKPFVFEVRDLWPELPRAMGVIRSRLLLRLLDMLEWVCYHSAHACVGLSPGVSEGIRKRGIPAARVTTIPNGCDLDLFRPAAAVRHEPIEGISDDDFVAAFTGTHGAANGLDAVLDAAAELQREGQAGIKLLFVGQGREKDRLRERAVREGLNNCVFAEPMPKQALAQLLGGRVDVGLMILANVPAFYYGTSPNKFFDYLASGLPVLANYPGWMAEMIEQQQIGAVIPPGDAPAFAAALCELASDRPRLEEMGGRAREFARRFDRDELVDQLIAVLERTAGPAGQVFHEASVSK